MANVNDVAAYILEKQGALSAMKLQKLAYYSQAWHLVWDDKSLFPERIEAWANGPVVRELYRQHRGSFTVTDWPAGDPANLEESEIETINAVLDFYGDRPAAWLSELTHIEDPWNDARGDLPAGARCENQITDAAMAEYYGGLVGGNKAL